MQELSVVTAGLNTVCGHIQPQLQESLEGQDSSHSTYIRFFFSSVKQPRAFHLRLETAF